LQGKKADISVSESRGKGTKLFCIGIIASEIANFTLKSKKSAQN